MMKKTLVALAAVAVTGGAFAQAVMTGSIGYAYFQTQTSAGATASGMGKDDASLNFTMTEDIEGLGKLTSKMGVKLNTTDKASVGRDLSMVLDMGSAGSLKVDSIYSDDYLSCGIASAGSCVYGSLGSGSISSVINTFSTPTYNEDLVYKFKLTDQIALSVAHTESAPNSGASGEGAGAAGYGNTADYQRYNTYSADYAAGALTLNVGYRTFDMANNATSNANYRHRASFAYDMGVAKIGAGYQQQTYTYGNTRTDTLVGISIPLANSPLTLSAQWGTRAKSGNASASSDTTYSGSIYNAVYKLSNRTNISGTYATTQDAGTSNPNALVIALNHSF